MIDANGMYLGEAWVCVKQGNQMTLYTNAYRIHIRSSEYGYGVCKATQTHSIPKEWMNVAIDEIKKNKIKKGVRIDECLLNYSI